MALYSLQPLLTDIIRKKEIVPETLHKFQKSIRKWCGHPDLDEDGNEIPGTGLQHGQMISQLVQPTGLLGPVQAPRPPLGMGGGAGAAGGGAPVGHRPAPNFGGLTGPLQAPRVVTTRPAQQQIMQQVQHSLITPGGQQVHPVQQQFAAQQPQPHQQQVVQASSSYVAGPAGAQAQQAGAAGPGASSCATGATGAGVPPAGPRGPAAVPNKTKPHYAASTSSGSAQRGGPGVGGATADFFQQRVTLPSNAQAPVQQFSSSQQPVQQFSSLFARPGPGPPTRTISAQGGPFAPATRVSTHQQTQQTAQYQPTLPPGTTTTHVRQPIYYQDAGGTTTQQPIYQNVVNHHGQLVRVQRVTGHPVGAGHALHHPQPVVASRSSSSSSGGDAVTQTAPRRAAATTGAGMQQPTAKLGFFGQPLFTSSPNVLQSQLLNQVSGPLTQPQGLQMQGIGGGGQQGGSSGFGGGSSASSSSGSSTKGGGTHAPRRTNGNGTAVTGAGDGSVAYHTPTGATQNRAPTGGPLVHHAPAQNHAPQNTTQSAVPPLRPGAEERVLQPAALQYSSAAMQPMHFSPTKMISDRSRPLNQPGGMNPGMNPGMMYGGLQVQRMGLDRTVGGGSAAGPVGGGAPTGVGGVGVNMTAGGLLGGQQLLGGRRS